MVEGTPQFACVCVSVSAWAEERTVSSQGKATKEATRCSLGAHVCPRICTGLMLWTVTCKQERKRGAVFCMAALRL